MNLCGIHLCYFIYLKLTGIHWYIFHYMKYHSLYFHSLQMDIGVVSPFRTTQALLYMSSGAHGSIILQHTYIISNGIAASQNMSIFSCNEQAQRLFFKVVVFSVVFIPLILLMRIWIFISSSGSLVPSGGELGFIPRQSDFEDQALNQLTTYPLL